MLKKYVSIKASPHSVNLKPVLELKRELAVNRDGLTINSKIYCMYKGTEYIAIATKEGYVYNTQVYPTLTALTKHIIGNVEIDSLDLWHLEGLSLSSYIKNLCKEREIRNSV